ncbi:hypothetical protein AVEN_115597-1 [Araneus ventricosus]|uniref:Uncharacterized protein n=1 Tax=Araneus ventricosus TaxID=182803 RepID=A0A4Y2FX43_ARAVE|nr:hypothetical protein AVEN_115597-1 [Araneus ventricosus]
MAFTLLYLSEDSSWRTEAGRKGVQILLFGRGIPLHKDLKYQDTIWERFPSWSFVPRTSFRVGRPKSHEKAVHREAVEYVFQHLGRNKNSKTSQIFSSQKIFSTKVVAACRGPKDIETGLNFLPSVDYMRLKSDKWK